MNSSNRLFETLEWAAISEKIIRHCQTDMGQECVKTIAPLALPEIKKQLAKISCIKSEITNNHSPDFGGISDISSLIKRTEKGAVLALQELVKVKNFVIGSERIRKFLKEVKDDYPVIQKEYEKIHNLEGIKALLVSSLTEDGEINETKYPLIGKLKTDIKERKAEIKNKLQSLLTLKTEEDIFQEEFISIRNNRYVVLIKSDMKGKIKGTVHDISASGKTLYIEPVAIAELNTSVLVLQRELATEIERILFELSSACGRQGASFYENLELLGYLDYLTSLARFSRDIAGNEPEVLDIPILELKNALHPLLYLQYPDKVIANDISLGREHNFMIISGANTGGKTVLLKTIGLCALLVKFGMHIPAGKDSRIGIFDHIFADIGDDQNLSLSLSTFSGQITVINEMLLNATEKTLTLIDEIIVGTNPRQGASLAQAILEELAEIGCKGVVTTHYSELKELASMDRRFVNVAVSFDRETFKPTYKLHYGLPGVSYPFEIAKNYGLASSILERAISLLDKNELTIETRLAEIQSEKEKLDDEWQKLDQGRRALDLLRVEHEKKLEQLRIREFHLKKNQGVQFLETLEKYKKILSEKILELQSSSLKDAGKLQGEMNAMQNEIIQSLEVEKKEHYVKIHSPFDPEKVAKGDLVFIIPLEMEAKIEEVNLRNKSVIVLLGKMIKSEFLFDQLLMVQKITESERKAQSIKSAVSPKSQKVMEEGEIPFTLQTAYNTIDLRGQLVEPALKMLDQTLDELFRQQVERVVIIHGHGTGAMKKAVRQNLGYSFYVSSFRPGDHGEGGDGVTIARLKAP